MPGTSYPGVSEDHPGPTITLLRPARCDRRERGLGLLSLTRRTSVFMAHVRAAARFEERAGLEIVAAAWRARPLRRGPADHSPSE